MMTGLICQNVCNHPAQARHLCSHHLIFQAKHKCKSLQESQAFIDFCQHYSLKFINSDSYYITYLSQGFTGAKTVRNYISAVRFIHRQMGLTPEASNSFPINCLLRAADLTARTPPLCHLPILPTLLHKLLCSLISSLGMLEPSMKVCLAFTFFSPAHQLMLTPLVIPVAVTSRPCPSGPPRCDGQRQSRPSAGHQCCPSPKSQAILRTLFLPARPCWPHHQPQASTNPFSR